MTEPQLPPAFINGTPEERGAALLRGCNHPEDDNYDTVALMIAHGADVNWQSPTNGMSACYWAAAMGHCDVVQLLIKARAAIDTPKNSGVTPITVASLNASNDATVLLLAHLGARFTIPHGQWAGDGFWTYGGRNPEPWTSIIAAGGDEPGWPSLRIRRRMLNAAGMFHPTRHDAWELRHCLMSINALISAGRATAMPAAQSTADVVTRLFTTPEDIVQSIVEYL